MRALLLVAVATLAGCIDPLDPQWQLDHDHVVVARATPPRIKAGDATMLDALVAHAGGPTTVESPLSATTTAGAMRQQGNTWTFVAPDASTIAAMGYANGPLAVDVVMTFPHGTDRAASPIEVKKTVWIGEPSVNPDMPAVTVDGAAPGDAITVPVGKDIYLSTTVPAGWRVNWLTSVGTMHQDDEPTGYVNVAKADRHSGELACVIRDDQGGVVWKVWPIQAQ